MLGNAARTETEAANALPPEGRTMQDVLNVKCSRQVASVKCQANVRQANTLRVVRWWQPCNATLFARLRYICEAKRVAKS